MVGARVVTIRIIAVGALAVVALVWLERATRAAVDQRCPTCPHRSLRSIP
jgi:hypothetical protein